MKGIVKVAGVWNRSLVGFAGLLSLLAISKLV